MDEASGGGLPLLGRHLDLGDRVVVAVVGRRRERASESLRYHMVADVCTCAKKSKEAKPKAPRPELIH